MALLEIAQDFMPFQMRALSAGAPVRYKSLSSQTASLTAVRDDLQPPTSKSFEATLEWLGQEAWRDPKAEVFGNKNCHFTQSSIQCFSAAAEGIDPSWRNPDRWLTEPLWF